MIGGHGHVTPRPDGAKARCGGPSICSVCAVEKAQYDASKLRVADMIAPAVSDAQELADHIAKVTRYAEAVAGWQSTGLVPDGVVESRLAEVLASAKRLMGLAE